MSGYSHLGFVVVGDVNAGKSATTGRLLFELGGMDFRRYRDLEKIEKEAKKLNKDSFSYAFPMNKLKPERQKGIAISTHTTIHELFTNHYHYSIIDVPGQRNFIDDMISGASQADVALLMVPAKTKKFETSIAKGNHSKGEIQGQTRQHALLCHLLGIEQLIVGINKMDDKSVNYSQDRYEEIKTKVSKMLTKMGYKTKKIPFIPMSGLNGDNVLNQSSNMPWYKGFTIKRKSNKINGITLVDALEKVIKPPKRQNKKPFRMPVSGVYKVKGVGDVITGRVEQGTIVPGHNVKFYPSNCSGNVFSIEMHYKWVVSGKSGDNISVNVKKLPKENMPRPGDIMVIDNVYVDPFPPRAAEEFTALVYVQDYPVKLLCGKEEKDKRTGRIVYKGGFTPSIHVRTAKAECQMIKINWKMGKSTYKAKVEDVPYIESGDQAEVIFKPNKPLVVQTFDKCKPLGRIAVMDSNSLIMLGKVIKVKYIDKR